MELKHFILQSKNIKKSSYVWNTVSSMLIAFQSVVMLMVATRVLGLAEAGILTIAFADANLFLKIGKYGMRNYQVSDVQGGFTFSEYFASRVLTTGAMLFVSVGFIVYMHIQRNYSLEKSAVIFWMCVLKMIESIEDIFYGYYQNQGRLDIAGKIFALRIATITVVFGVLLVLLKDLTLSIVFANIAGIVLLSIFLKWSHTVVPYKMGRVKKERVFALFRDCFPLFAGSFLSFYICNAPRYAIDKVLTDELQACYGFISMPIFVIELLNSFIFNPMLRTMSDIWEQRKIRLFLTRVVRQISVIAAITFVCITGAMIAGIPVLSWLYKTDLRPYKMELLILLLGGGFFGLVGFLNIINTIIRKQKKMMWGYGAAALVALLLSDTIVERYQLTGAAVLYTILMGILSLILGGLLVDGVLRGERQDKAHK